MSEPVIRYETHALKAIRLVLNLGEKEIGHAWLHILKNNKRQNPYGFLEDVFVDPEYRGRNLGKQLVEATIERAYSEGCYKFIATTRNSKKRVQQWYIELGLKDWGKEFRLDLRESKSFY